MLADKMGGLGSAKNSREGLDLEEDANSTVESYKRRYNSHKRNPLLPPKELLVNIPPKHPAQLHQSVGRKPYYLADSDLIVNGVGEAVRGMPRHPIRMGHTSND